MLKEPRSLNEPLSPHYPVGKYFFSTCCVQGFIHFPPVPHINQQYVSKSQVQKTGKVPEPSSECTIKTQSTSSEGQFSKSRTSLFFHLRHLTLWIPEHPRRVPPTAHLLFQTSLYHQP